MSEQRQTLTKDGSGRNTRENETEEPDESDKRKKDKRR